MSDYKQRSDEFWRKSQIEEREQLERWRARWDLRKPQKVSVRFMTEEERRAEPRVVMIEVSRQDDPDWKDKLLDKLCGMLVGELGSARVVELLKRQQRLLESVERLKEPPP